MEFVDGAELRDGASQRIDARGKRAGGRLRVLPGGEGIDGVVTVLKNRASGIEDGIGKRYRLRKIDIECADEMFAMNVEIGDGDGGVTGDFALERKAGLLNPRGNEVGREGGDIIGDTLGESGGKIAGRRRGGAGDQRIGIGGEDLAVGISIVVKKQLGVGEAVFGGDGGVIDLRDADIEQSVAAADDERMILAERIGESHAGAKL